MTDQLTETQEVTWEELYENVQDDNPNLGLRRLKEMMERLDPCRYDEADNPNLTLDQMKEMLYVPAREELLKMMERKQYISAYPGGHESHYRAWVARREVDLQREIQDSWETNYTDGVYRPTSVCTPHRLRVTGPVSAVPTIWIDENSRMDE